MEDQFRPSMEHRNAGTIQKAKTRPLPDTGEKIVGTFCVLVPEGIVLAADGIQVGLCAGAEAGKDAAEKVLPRNTCALIKSFVGFKLSRLCPFIESCDLVVGALGAALHGKNVMLQS